MNSLPQPRGRSNVSPGHSALAHSRGSVLMVALILAGVIALSLTSFLQLASHTSKMSNRSFYMDGAQNLSDLGLEHALWSMNNGVWTTGNTYTVTLPTSTTYYNFSANVKGQVKIWADLTNAAKPHVVVKATITLNDGSTLDKMAEAYIKSSSWFDDGVVAGTVTVGSNSTLDSWNSDPDANSATAAIPYSAAVAAANITVAATNSTANALSDGGKVYGSAAAGSTDSSGIAVGAQGIIGDTSYVNTSSNRGTIEDGHATYDFTASFPDVSNPSPASPYSLGNVNGNISLPRGTDSASGGYYYYNISTISLSGNGDIINITSGNVIITVTDTGNNAVSISGHGGIAISTGAKLKLYTAGNVSISGNGISNGGNSTTTANQPINFQLYGTRSSSDVSSSGYQKIDITGNGYLSGVIYAPNANVAEKGGGSGGDVLGAVVAHSVTFAGSTTFHYDESLPNSLTSGLWKLRKWRDLTNATNRSTYEALVNF